MAPLPSHPVNSLLVVSSNPRSGSSFTGELLSAAPQSSFFFEPLWHFVDTQHNPSLEEKRSLLLNLLQCNFHDPHVRSILRSDKQSTFIFRKPSTLGMRKATTSILTLEMSGFFRRMELRCRSTRTRVLKTIRLDMTELQSILESLPEQGTVNRYNLHVIYLARDPRGILNSVRALPSQWPTRLLSPLHICSRLLNDSVHLANHNLTKLMVLKYEDLASQPSEQLAAIEERFNISLGSKETRKFLFDHSSSSANWEATNDYRSGKWGPHKKQRREEDPVKEVMQVVARGKEELEEDVLLEQQLVDGLEGSDYYDDKGKIATVRRKKRSTSKQFKSEMQKARSTEDVDPSKDPKDSKRRRRKTKSTGDRDPQGRSFYYSTYRGKDFSPDHWRKQLPKKLLDEVAKEPACKEVMARFGYPDR